MPNVPIPPGARFLPLQQIMPTGGRKHIADISPEFFFSPLQPIAPMAPAGTPVHQWAYTPGANIIWQPGGDETAGLWILREFD
jgi:hypothetical protein